MSNCPEIQDISPEHRERLLIIARDKLHITKLGNYYIRPMLDSPTSIGGISWPIWLPTQGQLWEMYNLLPEGGLVYCGNWFYDVFVELLPELGSFLRNYPAQLYSMEQLLLAKVMLSLHNLVWKGEWTGA